MKSFITRALAVLVAIFFTHFAAAGEKATADEAVALVKRAAEYVKQHGKEKAFAEFNNPKGQFIDRDLYIFAFLTTGNGVEVANGGNPKVVGKNVMDMKDANGTYLIREIFKVAASPSGKGWVAYKWPNPVTKNIDAKKSYIEKVDDVILGAGVYQ